MIFTPQAKRFVYHPSKIESRQKLSAEMEGSYRTGKNRGFPKRAKPHGRGHSAVGTTGTHSARVLAEDYSPEVAKCLPMRARWRLRIQPESRPIRTQTSWRSSNSIGPLKALNRSEKVTPNCGKVKVGSPTVAIDFEMSIRRTILLLVLASSALLKAQEIKYIDLSLVSQHTELRYPPGPPPNCKEGTPCVGSGFGGVSVGCGAPDRRDPRALGVYLLRVTPTDINPADPFEAEFRVLNTGLAPIELPVSPHLSDLQPSDESAAFSYLSLALVVRAGGEPQGPDVVSVGFVELYGSPEHEGTVLVLRPGEWIGVRANVKLRSWPLEPVSARFRGEFWLRRNTFQPHPGGVFTGIQNLYSNATPTPSIAVHLVRPVPSDQPKQ